MRICIIGGYGNTGWYLAELLAREKMHEILIAGRHWQKAKNLVNILTEKYENQNIFAQKIDACQTSDLLQLFREIDIVVVCASVILATENIVRACLDSGCSYLDTELSFIQKHQSIRKYSHSIASSGLTFVTDCGFHPGLPGVLIRWAAKQFDNMVSAEVGSLIKMDWKNYQFSNSTREEMIEEFRMFKMHVVRNGVIKKVGYSGARLFDLGEGFGQVKCTPMWLEELAEISKFTPSINQCGFYVGGFDWFTDNVTIPILYPFILYAPKSLKNLLGRIFEWSLKKGSKPPFNTILRLESDGTINGDHQKINLNLSHEDPYLMTAIPVKSCLDQMINENGEKSGLWFQAHYLDPDRLMIDLTENGILITKTISSKD